MSGRGFLGRWSERKRTSRDNAATPEPPKLESEADAAHKAADDAATASAAPSAGSDEPPITDEELARLPPVEEAQTSADLRDYLRRGVPESLRRAALRRIWTLNPAIRDYVDPALDYAWDFNKPAGGSSVATGVASLAGTLVREAGAKRLAGPPPRGAAPQAAEAPQTAAAEAPPEAEASSREEGETTRRTRRRHGGAVPRSA